MKTTRSMKVLLFLSILVSLAACGGGGGGGGGATSTTPAGSSNWDSLMWDADSWT
jgi:hypothetical protein